MSDLWLAQYLCPSRHCICGLMYDRDENTPESAEAMIRSTLGSAVNPWCGLCGSRDLCFEHGRLKEQDPVRAYKQLRESEAAQQLTRAWVHGQKN